VVSVTSEGPWGLLDRVNDLPNTICGWSSKFRAGSRAAQVILDLRVAFVAFRYIFNCGSRLGVCVAVPCGSWCDIWVSSKYIGVLGFERETDLVWPIIKQRVGSENRGWSAICKKPHVWRMQKTCLSCKHTYLIGSISLTTKLFGQFWPIVTNSQSNPTEHSLIWNNQDWGGAGVVEVCWWQHKVGQQ